MLHTRAPSASSENLPVPGGELLSSSALVVNSDLGALEQGIDALSRPDEDNKHYTGVLLENVEHSVFSPRGGDTLAANARMSDETFSTTRARSEPLDRGPDPADDEE